MASKTYVQHTADENCHLARHSKAQGRKSLPVDLVKVKMEFMTLPATKQRIIAEAKKYGMSPSAYMNLAVSLFDISKFSS